MNKLAEARVLGPDDALAALAEFYGRTIRDLAAALFTHRPDQRGSCVGCSVRRRRAWQDCVHAYAVQSAVRELDGQQLRELTLRLAPYEQLPEDAAAVQRVFAPIDAP